MESRLDNPLTGIKVLDITEDRGLFTGRLLADFGADTIKIEEPCGSQARRIGPFKDDVPGLENSLYFLHFNINKRGITLDLATETGQQIFRKLVRKADVVIEDFDEEKRAAFHVDYTSLKKINKGIIVVSVTGFGLDGPYSTFKSPDIVNFAMGGSMYTSGEPDRAPVVAPCEQAYHGSSTIAAFCIMTALYECLSTGTGQFVEVSAHEVLAAMNEELIMRYSATFEIEGRYGSQHTTSPCRIYACKDGFVHIGVLRAAHWRMLLELLGQPDLLQGESWYHSWFRRQNDDIIDAVLIEFMSKYTKSELIELFQSRGVPCTPVNTAEDFTTDPHIKERGFIGELEHPVIGRHGYLKSPFSLSEASCGIFRDAPLLGQDNEDIYCGELGYSKTQLNKLKSQGII
jgi:CoA:oxalate CoA-transferase